MNDYCVADVLDEVSKGIGDLILDLGRLRLPQGEVRTSARFDLDVHPCFRKGKDSDNRAARRPRARSKVVGHFHAIERALHLDTADSIDERHETTVLVCVG